MKLINELTGLILFRNEEDYLPNSFRCVVNYVDELILLDDCSTDSSAYFARRCVQKYDHVRYIRLPETLSNQFTFADKTNCGISMGRS